MSSTDGIHTRRSGKQHRENYRSASTLREVRMVEHLDAAYMIIDRMQDGSTCLSAMPGLEPRDTADASALTKCIVLAVTERWYGDQAHMGL